jgi:hypothetical protein
MKNDAFRSVTPYGLYKNRCFRRNVSPPSLRLKISDVGNFFRSVLQLLITANVVPSSLIVSTLMIMFLRNVGSYKRHTA